MNFNFQEIKHIICSMLEWAQMRNNSTVVKPRYFPLFLKFPQKLFWREIQTYLVSYDYRHCQEPPWSKHDCDEWIGKWPEDLLVIATFFVPYLVTNTPTTKIGKEKMLIGFEHYMQIWFVTIELLHKHCDQKWLKKSFWTKKPTCKSFPLT